MNGRTNSLSKASKEIGSKLSKSKAKMMHSRRRSKSKREKLRLT